MRHTSSRRRSPWCSRCARGRPRRRASARCRRTSPASRPGSARCAATSTRCSTPRARGTSARRAPRPRDLVALVRDEAEAVAVVAGRRGVAVRVDAAGAAGPPRRRRRRPRPLRGAQPARQRRPPRPRRTASSASPCSARAPGRASRWPTTARASPEADREDVFDRFRRLERDARAHAGTGLGLAIVRDVAASTAATSTWRARPRAARSSPCGSRSSASSRPGPRPALPPARPAPADRLTPRASARLSWRCVGARLEPGLGARGAQLVARRARSCRRPASTRSAFSARAMRLAPAARQHAEHRLMRSDRRAARRRRSAGPSARSTIASATSSGSTCLTPRVSAGPPPSSVLTTPGMTQLDLDAASRAARARTASLTADDEVLRPAVGRAARVRRPCRPSRRC